MLNIRNKLQLADREDGNMTEHIIGTHLKDLTQIYSRKVTIRGTLTLTNVSVSSIRDNFFSQPLNWNVNEQTKAVPARDEAVITVGGLPFQLANVSQDYWMKSIDQVCGLVIRLLNIVIYDILFMFRKLVMSISFNRLVHPRLQRTF